MSKIRRRKCKNLKEFNKIIRKYIKYFGLRFNHNYQTYWYTWCYVDFIGIDSLNDKYLNFYAKKLYDKGDRNLKDIIQEVKSNYDWSYQSKEDGKTYYLRGVEISNEDYYYIYVSDDGSKSYNTCVGRFDDVY